ncbi:PKD-like family protein [Filimonas lacunae]|uniref:PKD-like family protein n=1 Tax=Filimonas lacunae TaxID=477680 RepID=A0A173MI67_9BACT|nr:PKD-like family lipoprotein [Filimonas lacunae]BAV07295.1 hypothetical protein FLA_3318 [Filimonas lacunae]SIS91823.1 PKD-like family protein [Filimonas lacunae]
MKKIQYLIGVVLVCFFMQSCYKDKGNYDYQPVGNVLIDTADNGILSSYAIYRYDTLRIAPKIYFNGTLVTDEKSVADKLDFTWVIFQATTGGIINTRDTLSHTIALSEPMIRPSGKWIVHLTVRELATQVETYIRFPVELSETTLPDGWMVLYEKDGRTDVGVIVDDRSKKGVVTAKLFLDLVKGSNGIALEGKPVGMVHSIAPLSSGEVLVASEHDFIAADKNSFEATFQFTDLFWTPPAEKSLQALMGSYQRKELVVNNNKIHTVNFASSGLFRTNKLGPAISGSYGTLANWAAPYYGASYDAVVYDKTNKKFIYVAANAITVSDFPAQANTAQFSPSDVGLDMKASDWGLSSYEYSIMGDNTASYLLVSNFVSTTANVGLKKISMTGSPEVESASTVAAAYVGQYVLYGAGANVYLFKYNSGLPAEKAWSAPAGEQVTCVRLQKFYYPVIQASIIPLPNQVVYIATWNEAEKGGKVYSYTIDPSSGSINKASERVTEGYGKVKDMSYKWNL